MIRHPRGVVTFLVLSFGIAWVIWEGLLGSGWVPGEGGLSLALLQGAFAPAIGAAAARIWADPEGFSDAGLKPNLRAWPLYLAAWLLPLAGAFLVVLSAHVTGWNVDFSLSAGLENLPADHGELPEIMRGGGWGIAAVSLTGAVLATPILFGEEFGWRGYLQRRLFPGRPLAAAVATGLIWAVWHAPLILRGYNFPGHPFAGMAVFAVTCVLLSIIFGWLRERSGSVWTASLAHASTNAVGASLVFHAVGRQDLFLSYVGIFGWLPLGLLAAWIIASGRLAPADGETS